MSTSSNIPIPTFPCNSSQQFNATIVDINGNLVDPGTVLFITAGSDGVAYSQSAIRVSQGVYYATFTTATPTGRWHYRFQGYGSLNVATKDLPYIVDELKF